MPPTVLSQLAASRAQPRERRKNEPISKMRICYEIAKQTHFILEIAALFPVRKPSARQEEPRTHDEPEVAWAIQRLRMRDRRPHRCEARGVGFAAQRAIPDVIGHPENRSRRAKMMRQM